MTITSVDVLLCTFRRPHVVDTLQSLDRQSLQSEIRMRIIVADNDTTESAREAVERCARGMSAPVLYLHAPDRNISIARNACLDAARADWVAMIDDDEIANPFWLVRLLDTALRDDLDAVFGPARAVYPDKAPGWMSDQDHHSNIPVVKGGEVTTGHTCNALLRWAGTRWVDQRFDLTRGRSGGEDTEYFFRLNRMGARFGISEDAVVTEEVDPARLDFRWLMKRKFRMGQSHASSAPGFLGKMALIASAGAKAAICAGGAVATLPLPGQRWRFWILRGALHCGVVAGTLSVRQPEIYGT